MAPRALLISAESRKLPNLRLMVFNESYSGSDRPSTDPDLAVESRHRRDERLGRGVGLALLDSTDLGLVDPGGFGKLILGPALCVAELEELTQNGVVAIEYITWEVPGGPAYRASASIWSSRPDRSIDVLNMQSKV